VWVTAGAQINKSTEIRRVNEAKWKGKKACKSAYESICNEYGRNDNEELRNSHCALHDSCYEHKTEEYKMGKACSTTQKLSNLLHAYVINSGWKTLTEDITCKT
jgi:hypothetical protein